MSDPTKPVVGHVTPLPGNEDHRPLDRTVPGHVTASKYVWVDREVYDQLRADLDRATRRIHELEALIDQGAFGVKP